MTLKTGSLSCKGRKHPFAPDLTNLRVCFNMYRAQVARFFKPSIDAILEAIKGIAGDLDPKNTVTADVPPDRSNSR